MEKVISDPINLLFTVPMLILAVVDFFSNFTENHKDFKNTIVGLGILGTFVGIFWGLQNFNPNKIHESIPPLLEGLKTAFWTSIAGMTISMILTIIETISLKKVVLKNEFEVLLEIDKNAKTFLANFANFQMQNNQGLLNIETAINRNFAPLQEALNKALEKISEGATKEIIKALENVIQDFNKNLTDQFGDNFKALNEAVKNMIVWQENYRTNVENMQKQLNTAVSAIESAQTVIATITTQIEEILLIHERLETTIKVLEAQINQVNGTLKFQSEIFDKVADSLENANSKFISFSENLKTSVGKMEETISTAVKNTEGIISSAVKDTEGTISSTAKNTTESITSSSSELIKKVEEIADRVISENANLFKLTMDNFLELKNTIDSLTEKFRNSLSNQSEAISKLNEEIKKQLPESLKSLGSALVTLTDQFKKDYEIFLLKIRELTSDLYRK